MNFDELLTAVKRRGGRLSLDGETFVYSGPRDSLSEAFVEELRKHHDDILVQGSE